MGMQQLLVVSGGPAFEATGGTTYTYNSKKIHKFTANGNFVVSGAPPTFTCEVVVVGGGGGGGGYRGGGGGSGGFAAAPGMPFGDGTFPVSIGAKGTKGIGTEPNSSNSGTDGGDTTIPNGTYTLTAKGGGYGGGGNNSGGAGGSGGGGAWPAAKVGGSTNQPPENSFPFPVGNDGQAGGNASPGPPKYGSGGGGGAGGAGWIGVTNGGGDGGWSLQLPPAFRDPTNIVGYPGPASKLFCVAGGGGGGSIFAAVPTEGFGGGPGGPFGGAGNGGPWVGGNGADAQVNSGSGGGGSVCIGDGGPDRRNGGDGGSGLLLIAYDA